MSIGAKIGEIKYKYGLAKRIIYSIISFIKMLTPLMTLEGEVGKLASQIEPLFLGTFNFLDEHFNIFLFVGLVTLLTGVFTYIVFPVGETACLLAAATGFILSPAIQSGFAAAVDGGKAIWDVAGACAPYVAWICLPTVFVGAVCVCKRINKRGGLVKTILVSGLATLIVGVLIGVYSYVAYGISFDTNPAQTCVFVSILLVTIAEQFFIFQKKTADEE